MALTLKIFIVEQSVTKVIQFTKTVTVFDACRIIREKITDANLGQAKDYSLFLPGEDSSGLWLEPARPLSHFSLKENEVLEYRRKMRQLKVRMLDDSVKTIMVDDSLPVSQLMITICMRIGITNYEEYSLVNEVEHEEQEIKPNFGTLTLKRHKDKDRDKDRDSKMESLKKKLKTDDEINWVDHSKTLREQGITEEITLLLKRKYFFSDQNIDSSDPVQLNLLYVQCRDAIVDGTHPVTLDNACHFAGIQCHIQFGDYNEQKHRAGFLDLKELLPPSYLKTKNVEKKIFGRHKEYIGSNELEAKVAYVGLARSLKTYGVTFFLVKEKMKGKNKLVPRLLGVTKDSVLRLDEKSKEILKTWPLTTVRRWAASPNTFTLDFGDYSENYYSVQTTEGEPISQLIAGYIDIILKKRAKADHYGEMGDDGSAMVEDTVTPTRATIIQHEKTIHSHVEADNISKPGIINTVGNGPLSYNRGAIPRGFDVVYEGKVHQAHQPPSTQHPHVTDVNLTRPQRALISTIESGQEIIVTCTDQLDTKAQLPQLGNDAASIRWKQVTLDSNKQTVTSQIAAMNAATAEVVTLTSSVNEEVDHTAVGAAVHTITSNLPEMTKGVKMIAALLEADPESTSLLHATRSLCTAFSDFLNAAEPERVGGPRTNLLGAASKVGEASSAVLSTIDSGHHHQTQDLLLGLAKAVANTTAALILRAKAVAARCPDEQRQNRVITAATACALATSQLVACAKVVAPTLDNPACKEQVTAACREVGRAVQELVMACQDATDDPDLQKGLVGASGDVDQALEDLLDHVRTAGQAEVTTHEMALDTILSSSDKLIASHGNAAEMVKQAKILAQATSTLIQSIKMEADNCSDQSQQNRLLSAAKQLAEATSRLVEAAKSCAAGPNDIRRQEILVEAAEEVRRATNSAASNALKKKIIKRLEAAGKHAAAAATQCMAASQGAGPHNTSITSQEALISDCRYTADVIPRLVEAVKGTIANSDDAHAQQNLLSACNEFLSPANKMAGSVKAALPTVSDPATSLQLTNCNRQFVSALSELRSALSKAEEACGAGELQAAMQTCAELDGQLSNLQSRPANQPLPGESLQQAMSDVTNLSKTVGAGLAQLLTAATQGSQQDTGTAARNTATALQQLTSSVRAVQATTGDRQESLVTAARTVMQRCHSLLQEAHVVLNEGGRQGSSQEHQELAYAARSVSQALNSTVSSLPSNQAVDEAVTTIEKYSTSIEVRLSQTCVTKNYSLLQEELTHAAHKLEAAGADVVQAAKSAPHELAPASKGMSTALGDVVNAGLEVASTQTQETRGNIVISLKGVSTASSRLLTTAKTVAADTTSSSNKTSLQQAARSLTDAINGLINVCTAASPGQNECDSAVRAIQATKSLLQSPSEAVSNASYYECLDSVMERSKCLGDAMTGIATYAKNMKHEEFGVSVKEVSSAICGLVEAASQAAYLVAISDPSSVPGRQGLLDQAAFVRAYDEIVKACQTLRNDRSEQQQVLSAATVIAKHTSSLCNACRAASSSTNNPVAKRHFVQSAKDVANATANLVKEIKALDQDYSASNRARCSDATHPLLEAVENLCAFANSPDFASVPAKISHKARLSQEPITTAGLSIIDGSCSMIGSAKSLALNPKDPPTWQHLATHSKLVSDSIKKLVVSIRDKAPGQKECDDAIDKLNMNIRNLDQASLRVLDQNLQQSNENNLQGFNEQMEGAARAIDENIDRVRTSGKSEAEKLGHAVTQLSSYFDPMVNAAIGSASHMTSSKQQMCLLDQTKTVCECGVQLLNSCKEAGGNNRVTHAHTDVDDSADTTKDTLRELLSTVESIATEAGVVHGLVVSITTSINKMGDRRASVDESLSFVDYQTSMVTASKEIARLAQEMVSKLSTDPSQLGQLSSNITYHFGKLAHETAGAIHLSSSPEIANRLRSSVHELGQSTIELIRSGGACQSAPQDTFCQRDMAESARHTGEKVVHVLAALQAGSQGTQACINAASTVSGIIGDLDTTIMFATAGTLNAENDDDCFSDHRENILKTAKALVEDTKTLVAGAASSQEQLAVAAQNAVTTIVQLSDTVKNGAASLGANNPDAQVMLVNAVKDVAMALGDLIHATKAASGKSLHDPAMTHLKESAKVMVTNVTSLLKTVKSVEDEHTRGTRALEATVEAIAQEIRAFDSEESPRTRATPEDLIKASKPITQATAKAVGAGNSAKQEDIIVAANMGRKVISDMLTTVKAAAWSSEHIEVKRRVLQSGHDTAVQYRELLQLLLHNTHKPSTETKQALSAASRKIATCVTDLVASAESLKANFVWSDVSLKSNKGDDWEDPEDPTVIAENELLGAASSIDAAAKKLLQLRPRRSDTMEVDENMNFDEIILEACQRIAAATGALVKAAGTAQRELVDSGRVRRRPTATSDDGQWSEGLVSAARLVAAATHSLCEAANALVQGHATEEKLIAAAKQVAGSTAQLLVACKVKADPNYASTKRLQEAGNAVKKATDNLVRAAQQAIEHEEEHTLVVNKRLVGSLAQEIDAREQVLKMENELLGARNKLREIRQAKYRGGESGQSDTDGNMSGYDSPYEFGGNRSSYSAVLGGNTASNGHSTTTYHTSTTQNVGGIVPAMQSLTVTGGAKSYQSTFTSHQSSSTHNLHSEAETSEVEEGPTFRDALKAFQSKSTSSSVTNSPSVSRVRSGEMGAESTTLAEQILQTSSQTIEKTIQHTTTNRSYHFQDR